MPQERGQEKEGTDLEDPQGSSKQKNFLVSHFQDLKEKYCILHFPRVLSPSTFHHPVTGSLWEAFPAGQKEMPQEREPWGREGAWTGVKQLQ